MLGGGYRLLFGAAVCAAVYGLIPTDTAAGKAEAVVIALLLLSLPLWWSGRLPALSESYFWPVVIAGLGLRLAWALTQGDLTSDALTYTTLAETLVRDGEYIIEGRRAYWPPGLPLALIATASPVFLNALIYMASILLIQRFAGMLGAAMFAFWPTGIFLSWVPTKELLCLPLLLGAVLAFRKERPVACGGLVGFAALTYPVLIVFPAVFLLERQWRRLALVCAITAAVVSPWIVRNAVVLGVPALGTNGGVNLYIGNSPEAGGTFYEPELGKGMGELERDAHLRREALAWIAANPDQALRLSLKKLVIYFGDDDFGAYYSIKRGHGIDGPVYEAARVVANLHWLALLVLIYVAASRGARPDPVALLSIGIGMAVAAVFYGHTNHHIEFEGFLIGLAVTGGVIKREARTERIAAFAVSR